MSTEEQLSTGTAHICLAFFITWAFGMELAQGWMKLLAIFFPPYGWYLLAERVAQVTGLMP